MSSQYRHLRAGFCPLPVDLQHLDIRLCFYDDHVDGEIVLWLTAREALDGLTLDAKELDLHAVEVADGDQTDPDLTFTPSDFNYDRDASRLYVPFAKPLQPGASAAIRARATCIPSDRILEGIYLDTTPAGCPPQFMSQSQQWGFQRFLPILDDCTAKCTMRTTLEGDARYTHLISNGDIDLSTNPDRKPVPLPDDSSRQMITYHNDIPMAPYLFIACAGTWDVLAETVTYPNGHAVLLEYLVPPGKLDGARIPMDILKDSVLWQGETQEYEYQRDACRTICMERSNFGGMENVGNTTIITSAALIDEYISDLRLKYAYQVIVHEFEHNQCGSDVTMLTPFDVWLNEGFTVDVERQYSMSRFDPTVTRLEEIDQMRAPIGGPLAVEDGGHMGQIVREGFNDPDELIDGVTYVKSAEVIRMLRLILGAEPFRQGKNLYFDRYHGGNADSEQFFACFEEVSGRDLTQFKKEWLHTIGYPQVTSSWEYDASAKVILARFSQSRAGQGGLFHIPLEIAAVDEQGSDIPGSAQVCELTGAEAEVEIPSSVSPAYLSLNRDCSFYGTFRDTSASADTLRQQALNDPNLFNRVEAMRELTDGERIAMIKDPETCLSDQWIDTYRTVLRDESVPSGVKAYLLSIDEQSLDRNYLPQVVERNAVWCQMKQGVSEMLADELRVCYEAVDTFSPRAHPADGMEERSLKRVLLNMICESDRPEAQALAIQHVEAAWNITDKVNGLTCLYRSSYPERERVMDEAYRLWAPHLAAYLTYLGIAGRSPQDDVFAWIAREEKRETFHIEHPGHNRALFLPVLANNTVLWTDAGLAWARQTTVRMAEINEYVCNRMLQAFALVDQFDPGLKARVVEMLEGIDQDLARKDVPSVKGRLKAYLGHG